ncbi:uncharacterized protein N7477_008459 [Penicillium maclennaniae]|uniref:uncharacterized protein n=1 Tax=Penicillium maclennaniae TaxID=1343394 RepID=UPI0025409F9E|nr:uncharacterized protein N7477_008459 [Penicillium maclennaniae]KAJ5666011.1 hypothetical protein N7477_008459 [Penicillium maclennaniae]
MDSDHAQSHAQPCGLNDPEQENTFRFTPIKAIKALPRLWERKPATPFQGGIKSKKLWKRFHASFSNMQSLQQSSALEQNAFQTALNSFTNTSINPSKDTAFARGVKRLRVASDGADDRKDTGKLPDAPFSIFDESSQHKPTLALSQNTGPGNADSQCNENNGPCDVEGDLAMTSSPPPLGQSRSPVMAAIFQDAMQPFDINTSISEATPIGSAVHQSTEQEHNELINTVVEETEHNIAPTPTKVVRVLTQKQERTLVRSALRSSLDGEDADLLNDFLSKAKAKRAAKAALVDSQEGTTETSSSADESPEEALTPRSRRVLEDLDANSPSPVKTQASPIKSDAITFDGAQEVAVSKEIQHDEPAPASPACRRSTRVKAPAANPAAVRNTIALRRAKGTEFVFLQRTEAQQLALATKKNTRHNRGDSVMPKYVLQAMAEQEHEESALEQVRSDRKISGRRTASKNVSWNDDRLVEFEDYNPTTELEEEDSSSCKSDVDDASIRSEAKPTEKTASVSDRRSRAQMQKLSHEAASVESESSSTTPTAVPAAAPRSRRVRRMGDSTGVSGTPVKTGRGRISKPSSATAPTDAPSTPPQARRKLVPKSPSSSLLPAPVAKGAASSIPTRSTNICNEEPKRKSMLQSSAGCTPRRVRVRN